MLDCGSLSLTVSLCQLRPSDVWSIRELLALGNQRPLHVPVPVYDDDILEPNFDTIDVSVVSAQVSESLVERPAHYP